MSSWKEVPSSAGQGGGSVPAAHLPTVRVPSYSGLDPPHLPPRPALRGLRLPDATKPTPLLGAGGTRFCPGLRNGDGSSGGRWSAVRETGHYQWAEAGSPSVGPSVTHCSEGRCVPQRPEPEHSALCPGTNFIHTHSGALSVPDRGPRGHHRALPSARVRVCVPAGWTRAWGGAGRTGSPVRLKARTPMKTEASGRPAWLKLKPVYPGSPRARVRLFSLTSVPWRRVPPTRVPPGAGEPPVRWSNSSRV